MNNLTHLIDKLNSEHILSKAEFTELIGNHSPEDAKYAAKLARSICDHWYGKKIYLRGLIEFTNFCKNDCLYCGIRRSNQKGDRYRLTKDEILECSDMGYDLGFRTFVLQGGEDLHYTDEIMCDIISSIKSRHPDTAVTLSIGEKTYDQYKKYFDAGANRYLLRHETANETHYSKLHPKEMSLTNRKQCLFDLKEIGYQVGTGFMVGSPYQTPEYLAEDFIFIHNLQPAMVGIGPFVVHHDTPFKDKKNGTADLTTFLVSLLRIMLPYALIPATTSLGTIDPQGREKGILAGANVLMPNLSPTSVRKKYMLYDNKICTGDEAAECRLCLKNRIEAIGYETVIDRGDVAVTPLD